MAHAPGDASPEGIDEAMVAGGRHAHMHPKDRETLHIFIPEAPVMASPHPGVPVTRADDSEPAHNFQRLRSH